MRHFTRIRSRVRWCAQPPVRCKSSWTSRKLDFAPASKQLPARQGDSKPVARAPDTPLATLDDARRMLKETFGHDNFRPEQETVVSKILAGHKVLLQWPEHSGRSTAYLTAGLTETKGSDLRGLIVVVSRSRPFLRYSAKVLSSSGVFAASIEDESTDLTQHQERMTTLAAVRRGEIHVLYLHTQQLEDHAIVAAIVEARGGLHLLVIDETHIHTTGDYDPGGNLFTKINDFMAKVRTRKTVILARNYVIHDYTDKYVDIGEVFTSHIPWFPQSNLRIEIVGDDPSAGFSGVRRPLESNSMPTLVFTSKDKRLHDLQSYLTEHGFHAESLVSQTTGEIDWEKLDDFSKSRLRILIANPPLFAIVDKPDLRQIIFATIPGNIERFDQLCRVVGRDGGSSDCVVLFEPRYLFRLENQAQAAQCTFAAIKRLVHEIFHLRRERLPAGLHSLILERRLILDLDLYDGDLSFVLSLLESVLGYTKLLFREYAGCQFEVLPGHESFLRTDRTPTGIAITNHSRQNPENGLFDLDIIQAARAERLSHFVELTAKMNSLQNLGHVQVHPRKRLLIFRLDKVPAPGPETEAVATWLHDQLLARYRDEAESKLRVREILFGNSCISAAMANHFGAQLPGGAARCGRCSVCLDGKPAKVPSFTPKEVTLDGIKKVLDEIPVRDNPRLLARVATGVHSPVIRHLQYHLSPAFRTMADCKFEDVLEAFARICEVPIEEA